MRASEIGGPVLAGRLPAHHEAAGSHARSPPRRLANTAIDPAVYSLIKFGNVSNHVVLTWTADDLAACADLNLPCADVSHLLAEPLVAMAGAGEGAGGGRWCCQAARLVSLQAATMGKGGPSTALASPACWPWAAHAGTAAGWGKHDWLAIVWLKPAVVLHVLRQGYVVMLAGAFHASSTSRAEASCQGRVPASQRLPPP